MRVYSYTNEDLSATINDSTSLLTRALVIDGIITTDQAKTINETYAVVVAAPSSWGRVIKKLISPNDKNEPVLKVVKLI